MAKNIIGSLILLGAAAAPFVALFLLVRFIRWAWLL